MGLLERARDIKGQRTVTHFQRWLLLTGWRSPRHDATSLKAPPAEELLCPSLRGATEIASTRTYGRF